jgi:anti-sigma factor (TIGR02949 family)
MKLDDQVAGIRCSEVLARLSDYLDGEVSPDERARIEAHVQACENCARFGGAFAATVGALRRTLGAEAAPATLLARAPGLPDPTSSER